MRSKNSSKILGTLLVALVATTPTCILGGCKHVDGNSSKDDGGDLDDSDDSDDTMSGGGDTGIGTACGDLSPCVESSVSGFTCPGSPGGVKCWNLKDYCSQNKLCASTSQACSIACDSITCDASSDDPPKPVCLD